ncbi:hypothetical protein KCU65_g258, partial [Aureobasidium melanogenum]
MSFLVAVLAQITDALAQLGHVVGSCGERVATHNLQYDLQRFKLIIDPAPQKRQFTVSLAINCVGQSNGISLPAVLHGLHNFIEFYHASSNPVSDNAGMTALPESLDSIISDTFARVIWSLCSRNLMTPTQNPTAPASQADHFQQDDGARPWTFCVLQVQQWLYIVSTSLQEVGKSRACGAMSVSIDVDFRSRHKKSFEVRCSIAKTSMDLIEHFGWEYER